MIHPIADCEHPLLCLLGPGLVSQETAISGSFQQTLASVCNGVSVWKLIMGRIPGYGSLWSSRIWSILEEHLLKGFARQASTDLPSEAQAGQPGYLLSGITQAEARQRLWVLA